MSYCSLEVENMSREAWERDIRADDTHTIIVSIDSTKLTPKEATGLQGLMALARRFDSVGRIRPLNQGDILPEPFNLDDMAVQQETA